MNRYKMPCSVSDDPTYDYSDYIEQEGAYASYEEGPGEPEDLHPGDPLSKRYFKNTHNHRENPHEDDKTKGLGKRNPS